MPDVLLTQDESNAEAVLDDTSDVRIHPLVRSSGDVVDVDAEPAEVLEKCETRLPHLSQQVMESVEVHRVRVGDVITLGLWHSRIRGRRDDERNRGPFNQVRGGKTVGLPDFRRWLVYYQNRLRQGADLWSR